MRFSRKIFRVHENLSSYVTFQMESNQTVAVCHKLLSTLFCLGICICLNKTNTYLARRKHRWQPSCESIRPSPRQNREETLRTQEDRYRTNNSIRDLTLVCYLGRDQVLHYVARRVQFS